MKAIQEIDYKDNLDCCVPCFDRAKMPEWFLPRQYNDWYDMTRLLAYSFACVAAYTTIETCQIKIEFEGRPISKYDKKYQEFKIAKERFYELLPELIKRYKGKYGAIIGDNIEIGDSKESLLDIVIDKYGPQTMYLSKIIDKKRVVRLRSPKLLKR